MKKGLNLPVVNQAPVTDQRKTCILCQHEISECASKCPSCDRPYPNHNQLSKCLHCKSMVLPGADRCTHCHGNPKVPTVPLPQHRTGTFLAGVIFTLWQTIPVWSVMIKGAVIAFIIATIISFWRGNKVNKAASCVQGRLFKFVGELGLFCIYSGIALLVWEILRQRF